MGAPFYSIASCRKEGAGSTKQLSGAAQAMKSRRNDADDGPEAQPLTAIRPFRRPISWPST